MREKLQLSALSRMVGKSFLDVGQIAQKLFERQINVKMGEVPRISVDFKAGEFIALAVRARIETVKAVEMSYQDVTPLTVLYPKIEDHIEAYALARMFYPRSEGYSTDDVRSKLSLFTDSVVDSKLTSLISDSVDLEISQSSTALISDNLIDMYSLFGVPYYDVPNLNMPDGYAYNKINAMYMVFKSILAHPYFHGFGTYLLKYPKPRRPVFINEAEEKLAVYPSTVITQDDSLIKQIANKTNEGRDTFRIWHHDERNYYIMTPDEAVREFDLNNFNEDFVETVLDHDSIIVVITPFKLDTKFLKQEDYSSMVQGFSQDPFNDTLMISKDPSISSFTHHIAWLTDPAQTTRRPRRVTDQLKFSTPLIVTGKP
jgi:hypothetical protein